MGIRATSASCASALRQMAPFDPTPGIDVHAKARGSYLKTEQFRLIPRPARPVQWRTHKVTMLGGTMTQSCEVAEVNFPAAAPAGPGPETKARAMR